MMPKPKVAATYDDIQTMSDAARKAFPGVDYIMAVKLPTDLKGVPTVTVYAEPGLKPVDTNLSGRTEIPAGNATAVQLMPGKDEILKLTLPDASVTYCTNRPRWFWMSSAFTTLE
jgi:hypothetical protein